MNGIVHPYYTVALAPAIAALVGIGATLLWQNRFTAAGRDGTVGHRSGQLDPGVRAVGSDRRVAALAQGRRRGRGSGGGDAAAGRGPADTQRPRGRWPAWRIAACLAIPAAYSIATAATPHRGAIPSAGPSGHGVMPLGAGGLLTAPTPGPGLSAALAADAERLHLGRRGAGIEQRGGLPIGQRRTGNGDRRFQRDRSGADAAGVPALRRRQEDSLLHPRTVDDRSMGRGRDAAAANPRISRSGWRRTSPRRRSTASIVYDLTQAPKNS